MKITMLGTGNAMVTECYNTCFVIEDEKKYFLVDGGGGNQIFRQLKAADIDLNNIHEIFVTHKHIDHLLGIIWLVRKFCSSMESGKFEGDVTIYGHDEVIFLIDEMASQLLQKKEYDMIGKRLHLVTVEDGQSKNIIGKEVTFFDIHSTKAKQFGFCMQLSEKDKLTCCGDEPFNECETQYCQNSTWLLCEAFCLFSEAELFKPYQKHHSTVKDGCQLAERLKVKNLILYHTEEKNLARRKELYSQEGKQYYHGNLYIPEDLETIELG